MDVVETVNARETLMKHRLKFPSNTGRRSSITIHPLLITPWLCHIVRTTRDINKGERKKQQQKS